jgi:manganese transport protein
MRKMLAYMGPGFLVAVGYMDPGNWATDIAGGARFGYTLISVILISNFMAMLVQYLSIKLGIATGRDLAQACRDHYSKPVAITLWILCELAIVATDLAELLGSAIALNLLFGIPILWGCVITLLDVFVVLLLQNKGFRRLEAIVIALVATIGGCFAFEMFFAGPDLAAIAQGAIPQSEIVFNPGMLYIAIGIIGATVMPHNLYLHSSIVQTRKHTPDDAGKREAIKYSTIDSCGALTLALFVNGAILVLAAATFHGTGHESVADIEDAHKLLTPLLGAAAASTLFAIALLASGQNATITGTLAGQIIMEGFLNIRIRPWLRRIITRAVAVVPAVVVIGIYGDGATGELLIASQVVLSLQLPFAVIPLIIFTSSKKKMGPFATGWIVTPLAWVTAAIVVVLNMKLLYDVAMMGGI